MKVRKSLFFPIVRMVCLIVVGLLVALGVALSRVNLEVLRGNLIAILRDATGMPIEIAGDVSWKFSLHPQVKLNQVRVANPEWAHEKYLFSADEIDVRINLISLLRDRPTIQNVKVYNANLNIEKNADGATSFAKKISVSDEKKSVPIIEKYPFKDAGLGGVEIKNLKLNIFDNKYSLAGLNIRRDHRTENREYAGWIKIDKDLFPFVVSLSEYNDVRKVYPMRIAMATGGDALIANVALEGTSKLPIDFIVRGDIKNVDALAQLFQIDMMGISEIKLNIAGGMDRQKLTLRKSSIMLRNTEFLISGVWNWAQKNTLINADVYSSDVDLARLFPKIYGKKRVRSNRDLNVFKDIPLFGKFFLGKDINLNLVLDRFVVFRELDISGLNAKVNLKNNHLRFDARTSFLGGDTVVGLDADIDANGYVWLQAAADGNRLVIGDLLKEINKTDLISELPVNVDIYIQANGENLSQIMQSITGPVQVHSVGAGYAHSALVSYMYGTDFLTSLRHSIEDLFTSEKKHNQIKISCVALNAMLRDGVFETQNGVAVETNAINIRLAGMLDLGDEKMRLSLATVPVRGIKLSLTGNVVNSIEISGSLAEPDIKISGAAVAGKVASATGLGLLLAPFTGGIGLVAGAGVGLVAGDLLENWLADAHPCETAMERGAPLFPDDPEWMHDSVDQLMDMVLKNGEE